MHFIKIIQFEEKTTRPDPKFSEDIWRAFNDFTVLWRRPLDPLRGKQFSFSMKMSVILFKTSFPASPLLYSANSMLASFLTAVETKLVLNLKLQAPLGVFQSLRILFLSPSNNFRMSRQIQKSFFLSQCQEFRRGKGKRMSRGAFLHSGRGGFLSQALSNMCPILQPGVTFINGFSEFMTYFKASAGCQHILSWLICGQWAPATEKALHPGLSGG